MGTLGSSGSGFSAAWFTDRDQVTGGERLEAVVLWRGASNMSRSREPFPWGLMIMSMITPRFLMKRLLARRFAAVSMDPALGDGWTSASGSGANQIRHDRKRRVVGIRSRIFGPPPAGHTLLVLVEDDLGEPDGIRVTERAVAMPEMTSDARIDRSLPRDEMARLMTERHRERHRKWDAALAADPHYARFMSGPPST